MDQRTTVQFADSPLGRRFSGLIDIDAGEQDALMSLQQDIQRCPQETGFVTAGESFTHSYIIQEGWAAHFKLLPDGRQQILDFSLPGDFIGLYAMVFDKAEHSVRAITDCVVSRIEPARIIALFTSYPRLAATICWSAATQGAILGEHVTRIGRRNAYERTAHLISELLYRLEHVGMVHDNDIDFPLTQELLADTLGLTPVHMNRTLRKLKNNGLIDYDKDRLRVISRSRLRQVAAFDPTYLEQTSLPADMESRLNP